MIEQVILSNLVTDEGYARQVMPFIKQDYFSSEVDLTVFNLIKNYIDEYNNVPSRTALEVSLDKLTKINQETYKESKILINKLKDKAEDRDWLVNETEEFCQEKALFNAVKRSILIIDGEDKEYDKGAIPELVSEALAVTFDNKVGHDYIEEYLDRYDFYHAKEDKLSLGLDLLDRVTKGGVSRKSLSIILAPTGVGKTLAMCNFAAHNYMEGKNVLYITNEMAEERISERIDANLLDLKLDDLKEITKASYTKKFERLKERTTGKLIVKEYPTSTAGANHFRHLLNELKLKKKFVPDIIYIDYLNICISSRIRNMAGVNSYTYIKSIAEELRGLAVEFNVPIVSATQVNREGFGNSDIELTNTSESIALPATCDFMCALVSNDELESMGKLMIKQLKNRWGDLNYYKRFTVGIDRSKMKLFDSDDNSDYEQPKEKEEKNKPKFSGFV